MTHTTIPDIQGTADDVMSALAALMNEGWTLVNMWADEWTPNAWVARMTKDTTTLLLDVKVTP